MTEREDDATQRRIGAIAQRRRLDLELTAAGLARKAGVNIRTLASLESGDSWPRQTSRAKLERALGMPLGAFEYLADEPGQSLLLLARAERHGWDQALRAMTITMTEGSPTDEATDVPITQVPAALGGAREQLRAANIAVAAERLTRLPAEDIARVQDLIDELGRARFSDWDDEDDYAMAWNRRATLRRPTADEAQAVIDMLDAED
ncbi:multiprotein-bridging factor 1 family protein [Nocardia sp. NPDC058519]|uniref:helix-turn-helix domain-containing protein n=1 Tax=Nocardia sp. NPDC058519 TaxID=3346535 RepID=UPI00366A19E2